MHPLFWILIACGAVFAATLVSNILWSFSGVWERMDNTSKIAARERIRLAQFGCLVLGKRVVVGGAQRFIGLAIGSHLWMRRRDYGLAFLSNEGFPKEVAQQIEGQVMARYRVKLSDDHNFLEGVFVPFRVEFSSEPPRVTAMHAQPSVPRKYRRTEMIVDEEVATAAPGAK